MKIRPARFVDIHQSSIARALALHGGAPRLVPGGDFVVSFSTRAQIVEAIRAALLVNTLLHLGRDHVTVRLGLHTTDQTDKLEKATKQATYLASISDNNLLASKDVYLALGNSEQVTLQAFRSSLAPDGEVYFVDSLNGNNEELIQRQARQLFNG